MLKGRHAYSYVNSLSSAMQAFLTLGSEKHLRAARNAFDMLAEQSFATGGWGPDETLRAPGSPDVCASLDHTHNSFETPCGSYAHFKLTRYLMRVTRDSKYGDSMERVMYNTVLGAKPLMADGEPFIILTTTSRAARLITKISTGLAVQARYLKWRRTIASTSTFMICGAFGLICMFLPPCDGDRMALT